MAVLRQIPLGSITLHLCSAAPSHSASNGDIAVYNGAIYGRVSGSWSAIGGGAGGAVDSVFGRTGTVVAAANDYSFAQLSGSAAIAQIPTGTTGTTVALGNHNHTGVYAAASHTHAQADVTNLVSDLAGKAASVHTHAESDITGLVADLAGKASSVHTHAESDVTNLVSDLAAKAPVSPQYVTLATDATLTNERVLTAGTGITLTDAGAGSTVTVTNKSWGLRTTANVALSASTTINVTALDLTVASGEVYVLDYFFPVTVSGGTVGLKPIFTLPGSSTGTFDAQGTTTAVTATSFTHSTTPTTASAVAFITASFTGFIYVRAVLTMGGAGTLRIGFTTGASAAGNILAGSSLMVTKI